MAVGLVAAGAGCATPGRGRPDPVTVPQILEMSKAGVSADDMIAKMKASRTIYRMKASELTGLQNQGVPAVVVDYMQQTYLDAVRREAAYDEWRHWSRRGGYWYGGTSCGWPYSRVYVIREHEEPRRPEPNLR